MQMPRALRSPPCSAAAGGEDPDRLPCTYLCPVTPSPQTRPGERPSLPLPNMQSHLAGELPAANVEGLDCLRHVLLPAEVLLRLRSITKGLGQAAACLRSLSTLLHRSTRRSICTKRMPPAVSLRYCRGLGVCHDDAALLVGIPERSLDLTCSDASARSEAFWLGMGRRSRGCPHHSGPRAAGRPAVSKKESRLSLFAFAFPDLGAVGADQPKARAFRTKAPGNSASAPCSLATGRRAALATGVAQTGRQDLTRTHGERAGRGDRREENKSSVGRSVCKKKHLGLHRLRI